MVKTINFLPWRERYLESKLQNFYRFVMAMVIVNLLPWLVVAYLHSQMPEAEPLPEITQSVSNPKALLTMLTQLPAHLSTASHLSQIIYQDHGLQIFGSAYAASDVAALVAFASENKLVSLQKNNQQFDFMVSADYATH